MYLLTDSKLLWLKLPKVRHAVLYCILNRNTVTVDLPLLPAELPVIRIINDVLIFHHIITVYLESPAKLKLVLELYT